MHISKVRSINLDNWSIPMTNLLQLVGNANSNRVYEGTGKCVRPEANSSRDVAERFIRAKYVERSFVVGGKNPSNALDLELWNHCKQGSILDILRCIAIGANLKFVNTAFKGFSNLHAACLGLGSNPIECVELLTQNGADIHALDEHENSTLDIAIESGRVELIAFVVAKLESVV